MAHWIRSQGCFRLWVLGTNSTFFHNCLHKMIELVFNELNSKVIHWYNRKIIHRFSSKVWEKWGGRLDFIDLYISHNIHCSYFLNAWQRRISKSFKHLKDLIIFVIHAKLYSYLTLSSWIYKQKCWHRFFPWKQKLSMWTYFARS